MLYSSRTLKTSNSWLWQVGCHVKFEPKTIALGRHGMGCEALEAHEFTRGSRHEILCPNALSKNPIDLV